MNLVDTISKREFIGAIVAEGFIAAGYGRSVQKLQGIGGEQVMNFDAGQIALLSRVLTDALIAEFGRSQSQEVQK